MRLACAHPLCSSFFLFLLFFGLTLLCFVRCFTGVPPFFVSFPTCSSGMQFVANTVNTTTAVAMPQITVSHFSCHMLSVHQFFLVVFRFPGVCLFFLVFRPSFVFTNPPSPFLSPSSIHLSFLFFFFFLLLLLLSRAR
jgi:hypothetical protein